MKQLNNQSNKVIKIYNIIQAKTLLQKTTGLLNTITPHPLYFQTRWGIHTFGMKYSIDVLILDDHFIVKKMKQNLTPNTIFLWNPKYKNVIELPEGTIKKKKINIGNKLSFA